jgi:hypothetical protein
LYLGCDVHAPSRDILPSTRTTMVGITRRIDMIIGAMVYHSNLSRNRMPCVEKKPSRFPLITAGTLTLCANERKACARVRHLPDMRRLALRGGNGVTTLLGGNETGGCCKHSCTWRMQEKSGMLKISTRDHFEFSMTSSLELLQSSWKKVMGNVDKI